MMSCATCGHDRHDEKCAIYTAGKGWCSCKEYESGGEVHWLKIPGRATYRKMYAETQAFRDRAVKDAAAKARKVGNW
jgi:hypothetical protein